MKKLKITPSRDILLIAIYAVNEYINSDEDIKASLDKRGCSLFVSFFVDAIDGSLNMNIAAIPPKKTMIFWH